MRVHLFVATLGYSRRPFVRAFRHKRSSAWLEGMEGAFPHFGGIPHGVVFDNARALVIIMMRPPARCVSTNTCTRLPMGLPTEGLRAIGGGWS